MPHSLLLELFTDAGHRHQDPARLVSALAPTYARYPVEFAPARAACCVDADGVEYLDFLGGISVCNTGHCHPHVVAAVQEQAARLMHVGNLYSNAPMVRLAERLATRSLGGVVFFANSGAEANEAAIKLVRKARPRGDIVVVPRRVPRPHLRRAVGDAAGVQAGAVRAAGARLPRDRAATSDAVRAAVDEHTAAVLMEPILGESGVHPMPDELLRAAREACDAVGAALVFDEVQTGMGRTGTLWAYEQTGVVPDAMTVAKGLGGGVPIGALVIGPRAGRRVRPRRPRLDVRRRPARVRGGQRGASTCSTTRRCSRACASSASGSPRGCASCRGVTEVRGVGLMVAVDVDARRAGARAPRAARAAAGDQRDRPAHAAVPAAAGRHARRRSTTRSAGCARLLV